MHVIGILVLKILFKCQLACYLEKGQFYYCNLINEAN